MKPDWKDAPKWANYLAKDEDGTWWWFEKEPIRSNQLGMWRNQKEGIGGRYMMDPNSIDVKWENSLEERPK